MKLQGLHWLILAQLARRGGHVSRPRIPVESIDGYVQALREANGRQDTVATKQIWQPKSGNTAAGVNRLVNPVIGQPPNEFLDVDLTELEKELESVLYANDEWVHVPNESVVDWTKAEGLTIDQMQVQDWWDSSALPVHGLLETHVLNDLLTAGAPFELSTVEKTLGNLALHGCERERRLAEQALIDFKEVRAGKMRTDEVLWGVRREWGAFIGQDMHVGRLHYNVIDFGEDLLLDSETQRLIGAVDKRERKTSASYCTWERL